MPQRERKPKRPATAKAIPLDDGELGSDVELAQDAKLRTLGYWFDAGEADRVCVFFEKYLCHSQGEWYGKPLELAPWQRQKLRRLFGWRRPDGTRRYRRSSWWIPRKNGKSTLFAGIALYLLHADGEPGAQIYSAASNAEQALAVFGEAKRMTDAAAVLSDRTEVLTKSLFVPRSGSVFRVLTSKAGTKHGLNVHGVVIDEVHSIKDIALYSVLTSASGARRQPLELTISTAGDNIGAWGYGLWEYCIKVRDGLLDDPHFLAVVYAADPTDDWRDERTWEKANPNLDISLKREFLREELVKTKGMPAMVAAFKQLYLNIWAQSSEAWLNITAWRKCLVQPRPVREYRGKPCWCGLDLSSTTDLTAFVALFDMGDGGPLEAAAWFWCPQDTILERQRADNATYVTWADQGFLRPTPGNVVDYDLVERDVCRLGRWADIREIAFDSWGASQIVQRLQDYHGFSMNEFRQGYRSMSAPSKELERLHLSRGIRIVNNPVLTWMASSVHVQRDVTDSIKPVKRNPTQRIDGIVALVMALARATLRAEGESVYSSRGLTTL